MLDNYVRHYLTCDPRNQNIKGFNHANSASLPDFGLCGWTAADPQGKPVDLIKISSFHVAKSRGSSAASFLQRAGWRSCVRRQERPACYAQSNGLHKTHIAGSHRMSLPYYTHLPGNGLSWADTRLNTADIEKTKNTNSVRNGGCLLVDKSHTRYLYNAVVGIKRIHQELLVLFLNVQNIVCKIIQHYKFPDFHLRGKMASKFSFRKATKIKSEVTST